MSLKPALAISLLLTLVDAARAESALELHVVPVPVRSYRLLAMSMDAQGHIWTGSIHRVVHRYDPRSGDVESIPLPYDCTAASCICAGQDVYILGQGYPRLIIYNRKNGEFREAAYPSPKPDVWYGTELIGGRYLYLFDRGGVGLIKWDTTTDTGQAIRYPYQTPLPSAGHHESRDGAIWCRLWRYPPMAPYEPVGLARLDVNRDRFTGCWEIPKDDSELRPFADPATTFFVPFTMQGKIIPFDSRSRRWCRFVDVPGHGRRFGFIGGPVKHNDRYYFTLSSYDGDDIGCDGNPYHFLNEILEFDPRTRSFEFLTLRGGDGYYQISYMLSAGGEFFATGSNIRTPAGSLDQGHRGEVVFWQSNPPARSE